MDKYYIQNLEKNFVPRYDYLIGPNGFECCLSEPEDRTWSHDGQQAVRELNRLQSRNESLTTTLAMVLNYLEQLENNETKLIEQIREIL